MTKKYSLLDFFRKNQRRDNLNTSTRHYISSSSSKTWNSRDYKSFSEEAFIKNVIANRSISMISKSSSAVKLLLYKTDINGNKVEIQKHPVIDLINKPNQNSCRSEFIEAVVSYFLTSGNSYIYAQRNKDGFVESIHNLRPDRVEILPNENDNSFYYVYRIDNKVYEIYPQTGFSDILHIKSFHPLDDWYGLSVLESAHYSIEQHNECIKWNKSLLKNGARPAGAIIVKQDENSSGTLSDEQFEQLKEQLNSNWSGGENAGKVLILEGGLEWQEMSVSPKDMDFIETKNSAARDIALSIGVPPQMLGIKGDNTYNNMAEARVAMWEETILPLLDRICQNLSIWMSNMFGEEVEIGYDQDSVSALNGRRQILWNNLKDTDFITIEEKREMLGFGKEEE